MTDNWYYFNYPCSETILVQQKEVKRNFCKIPCMTEYYNVYLYGSNPSRDCQCDPDNFDKFKDMNKPPIPYNCYEPDGNDCEWYRNCLEKRYNCPSSENYAINYGEKFCKLYDESYNIFSNDGKNWVNNVRKCLQLESAPILKTYNETNCTEIQKIAFNSHTPCYIKPLGKPGFCTLGIKDKWKTFCTIKSAFIPYSGAALNSLTGLFKVLALCFLMSGAELLDQVYYLSAYKVNFEIFTPFKNQLIKSENYQEKSIELSNSISNQLNLNSSVIDVYVYINESSVNHFDIYLYFTSIPDLDLSVNKSSSSSNLIHVNEKFLMMIRTGKLKLSFKSDDERHDYIATKMFNCSSLLLCENDEIDINLIESISRCGSYQSNIVIINILLLFHFLIT
jgi:hypothetical protein